MLTIAGLARAADVGVETVRFYQRRGLIDVPARSGGAMAGGGIRRYDARDVQRLRFIRTAQRAGFTLDEIAVLLKLDAGQDRRQAHRMARERIVALDERIAELQAARAALARLADECAGEGAGPCPILTAFDPPATGADGTPLPRSTKPQ